VWSIEPKRIIGLAEGVPGRFLQTQTRVIAATQGRERFMAFQQLSGTISFYRLSE
jgi:hypothetical protein